MTWCQAPRPTLAICGDCCGGGSTPGDLAAAGVSPRAADPRAGARARSSRSPADPGLQLQPRWRLRPAAHRCVPAATFLRTTTTPAAAWRARRWRQLHGRPRSDPPAASTIPAADFPADPHSIHASTRTVPSRSRAVSFRVLPRWLPPPVLMARPPTRAWRTYFSRPVRYPLRPAGRTGRRPAGWWTRPRQGAERVGGAVPSARLPFTRLLFWRRRMPDRGPFADSPELRWAWLPGWRSDAPRRRLVQRRLAGS